SSRPRRAPRDGRLPHLPGSLDQYPQACPGPHGACRPGRHRRPALTRDQRRWRRVHRRRPRQGGFLRPARAHRAGAPGRRMARGFHRRARLYRAAEPAARGGQRMIRVILVDDHQLVRRGVRETLIEASGFEVVGEAADYSELRELLRSAQADVLVLDINLPGRSGLEVLKSLDEAGSRLRVVMLSQYPEDQYGIRALKAGAMAYLNKA